jgi:hypothetical protein
MSTSQVSSWCATLHMQQGQQPQVGGGFENNNSGEMAVDSIKAKEFVELIFKEGEIIRYIICGNEICPDTGRDHLQMYIQFNTKKTAHYVIKMIKDLGFGHPWVKKADGDYNSNYIYCSKDQDFTEAGRPTRGRGQVQRLTGTIKKKYAKGSQGTFKFK